jgi:hypothetical protein
MGMAEVERRRWGRDERGVRDERTAVLIVAEARLRALCFRLTLSSGEFIVLEGGCSCHSLYLMGYIHRRLAVHRWID